MDLLILLCFLFIQNVGEALGLNEGVGVGNNNILILTPSDPSITKFENESCIISCETVQKDIDTKWRDPSGQTRENTKGRVHIEKQSGHLVLVFEHILLSDRGNWTCEVSESNVARKSIELLVNQLISFGKTELVQSVREGRDATVHCFVTGEPVPEVTWMYNGEIINTVNSTKHKRLSDGLFIKNVSQVDAGEYTCRAMRITPIFTDSDQITILLRIQHKPHWVYNETAPMQFAYIGGAVNLSCDAMGEPPPNFTWLHNGKAIVGHNHRVFYSDYGSTLQLLVKNETQFGDYKCKVTNPLGMLERIIKLRIGPKPHSPTVFQLKRWYADGFELDIRTPKIQNAPDDMQVYGYRVEYMSENDFKYSAGNWSYAKQRDFTFHRGHRFIISQLAYNTSYLMRAASRNMAGLSDWCHVKTFATLSNHACNIFKNLSSTYMLSSLVIVLLFANFSY